LCAVNGGSSSKMFFTPKVSVMFLNPVYATITWCSQ
jgi:hypothetical protein